MSQKRRRLSPADREAILNKYNGHCAYCGKELTMKDMQVDHIIPLAFGRGEDTFENMNPSCRRCNYYKGCYGLERFRIELGCILSRLQKEFLYNMALQYGLIDEHKHNITFYYENFNGKTEGRGGDSGEDTRD